MHIQCKLSHFLKHQIHLFMMLVLSITVFNVAAAPPDFSSIDDILEGRRTLLPVDDLVITQTTFESQVSNRIIHTMESQPVFDDLYDVENNGSHKNVATGIGRLFNLPRDVIVTMIANEAKIRNPDPTGAVDKSFTVSGFPRGLTMADFTGDGYDDIALLSADQDGSTSGVIKIVTANDVQNLDSGLFSSDGVGPFEINFDKKLSITSGDFNGDGDVEFAIAQILSGSTILIYIYDLEISTDQNGQIQHIGFVEAASLRYDATFTVIDAELTAGDYNGVPNATTGLPDAELMLSYRNVLNGGSVMMRAFNVTENSTSPDKFDISAAGQITLAEGIGAEPDNTLFMRSNRLEWFGVTDQVVALYSGQQQQETAGFLSVVKADDQLNLSTGALNQLTTNLQPKGMVLGNFDQNLDSTNPISLEVAILFEANQSSTTRSFSLDIGEISAKQNYKFNLIGTTSELFLNTQTLIPLALELVSGDTQGRSLVLGPPKKISITEHSQAAIIMGAPPMHIDYIKVQNPSTPGFSFKMINMTAFPSTDNSGNLGMNTQFSIGSSEKGSNTRTQSSSYTYSTTETVDAKISFGIPDIDSVSASMKSSAEQTHSNLVQNKFGTFSAKSFEIDAKSGFGDALWFLQRQFYLWVYPVIGIESCSDDSPNCPASCGAGKTSCPQLPLQIIFSGPQVDKNFEGVASNGVEWAQPAHEVGNILSYPGNQQQLEAETVGASVFDLLAGPNSFETGSSGVSEKVSWLNGSSEGNTSGSVKTYSDSVSVSASASGYLEDIGIGASGSASFTTNTSSSFHTLNTAVETIGSTTGVEISVPAFNDAETYSYPITGFVFGEKGSPNVIQTDLSKCLKPDAGSTQSDSCPDGIEPVDFASHGTVQVGFSADPGASSSGNWWQSSDTYLVPDVAIQHQNRWRLVSQGSAPLSSQYCFNIFNQQAPLNTPAYDMKGFFVLPKDAVNGPQQTIVNSGEILQLQARIHNYSLVDMDDPSLDQPASEVQVQIYAQEWCTISDNSCSPNTFVGPAFLVGETTTTPIPGANSSKSGNPVNNKLAGVNWGTEPDDNQPNYGCGAQGSKISCDGKYLKFWVVTWMVDNNGDLVTEYKDHGLSMLPKANLTQIGQVPIQPISNNVGLYPQAIHICPNNVQCPDPATIQLGELNMDTPVIAKTSLNKHEETDVSATLHAGDYGIGPVLVAYYDGDPENGGKVFDIEHVPFVAANSSYVTKVKYHPNTAGKHSLHVTALLGEQSISSSAEIQVSDLDTGMATCINPLSPGTLLAGRARQNNVTPLFNNNRFRNSHRNSNQVSMYLTATKVLDGPLDLRSTKVSMDRLLNETGGTGEMIRNELGDLVLPLTFDQARFASRNFAVFRTPRRQSPAIKLVLIKRHNLLWMFLHVKSDFPLDPKQCNGLSNKTTIETRFTAIDDGVNPPFMWPISAEWECKFDRKEMLQSLNKR